MPEPLLKTIAPHDLPRRKREPVDRETLAIAQAILDAVRERGEAALREYAERFGDVAPGAPLIIPGEELRAAWRKLPAPDQRLLERAAQRIRRFARAQRRCLKTLETGVPGGKAGHFIAPVERAGCYAPGGRFPLPSSMLMTAVTARVAGVGEVWVASPKPTPVTLAAAHLAEADGFLAAGGAQAIGALAFGAGPVPPCDAIVGPGNRFVTAAKQLVAGRVQIDLLAGPSELAILAGDSADAGTIAADLLAQAEHDPQALPVLVTASAALIAEVNRELARQLADLPARETAAAALQNGFAVLTADVAAGLAVCNQLAPEHLQLQIDEAPRLLKRLKHYGALFIGPGSAEVLGDYGAGPNHTLPTGGTARHTGGLSVFHFLRVRTWLSIDRLKKAKLLTADAVRFAELEGLAAHARSAKRRLPSR